MRGGRRRGKGDKCCRRLWEEAKGVKGKFGMFKEVRMNV